MTHPDIVLEFSLNKDKVFNELIQDLIGMISISNDSDIPINNQILTNRIGKTLRDLQEVVNRYQTWNRV